jgi:hypothetical protein
MIIKKDQEFLKEFVGMMDKLTEIIWTERNLESLYNIFKIKLNLTRKNPEYSDFTREQTEKLLLDMNKTFLSNELFPENGARQLIQALSMRRLGKEIDPKLENIMIENLKPYVYRNFISIAKGVLQEVLDKNW